MRPKYLRVRDHWITTVGCSPVPQASAGGVILDGKAPPEDAPAETLRAKLTEVGPAATLAQRVEQFVVNAI